MKKSLVCLQFEMMSLTEIVDSALDDLNSNVIKTVKTLSPEKKLELYSRVSKDLSSSSISLVETTRKLKNRIEK